MNNTSAAEASTHAVSPGLILGARWAAAATSHTVSTRHLQDSYSLVPGA